jgi:putative FmdB family regulatory protein
MPLYEYECTNCHKRTEKIQKFSDPEITECPFCSGKLERVLSAPAVSFKGGGWYADLYSSSKKPAAANNNSASSDSSSTSTGSTATPAAAPASAPAAAATPSSSSSDKK